MTPTEGDTNVAVTETNTDDDTATVRYETRGPVAILTLNRPDRLNAWTGELGDAYWNGLDRAVADPDVRAIVVTGAGKGFCAGADMDMLQGIGSGSGGGGRELRSEHQTYTLSVPKIVIGAINGACAGLGLVQATMFDVRIAAAGAKFTTAFAKRGLIAEHGIGWVLPRLVGPSRALDLLLSARVVLAEEALDMGLVNRVVPADEVLDAAIGYATDIAENVSPASIATMKRQVWSGLEQTMAASNEVADDAMAHSLRQPDFREGVASFVERRPPEFAPLSS
ncbi:MAG: enoyl-CoA hydratase-related protein [Actinomycetota bacterium]|nr:enoyl-CoA hydratase-related protein [Actinomycetota bacterium]